MRGKPVKNKCGYLYVKDHPRGCGENGITAPALVFVVGSPPRMRGKRHTTLLYRSFDGITPADAGKTVTYLHDVESAKDHPRGCGENRP